MGPVSDSATFAHVGGGYPDASAFPGTNPARPAQPPQLSPLPGCRQVTRPKNRGRIGSWKSACVADRCSQRGRFQADSVVDRISEPLLAQVSLRCLNAHM